MDQEFNVDFVYLIDFELAPHQGTKNTPFCKAAKSEIFPAFSDFGQVHNNTEQQIYFRICKSYPQMYCPSNHGKFVGF